jgi:ABC-type branched-subunit amino acid transport system substrate-binding protein
MLARRRFRYSELLLLSVLLLTACLKLPESQVIKIGLVAPFEGHYRHIGYDAIYAARLAVREANSFESLDGWRIELVAYDDRANTELARRIADNLIVDPDVVAVIGHYQPETSLVAAQVYAEAGLPFVTLGDDGAASPSRHLTPEPERLAQALLSFGIDPTTETAIVRGENPVAAAVRAALEHAGVQRRSEVSRDPPDVAFNLLSPIEAAEQANDWWEAGWEGRLVGGMALADPAFVGVTSGSPEGAFFVTPYPFPRDLDGLEEWITAYKSMGPHVPEPGLYALPTYEAVHVIVESVSQALASRTEPNRQTIDSALAATRRIGLLGNITWESSTDWTSAPLYLYQWSDETPELMEKIQ